MLVQAGPLAEVAESFGFYKITIKISLFSEDKFEVLNEISYKNFKISLSLG